MVTIYGFDSQLRYCMYCEIAKKLCKQKKINFTFKQVISKDVDPANINGYKDNQETQKELLELLGRTEMKGLTMPQIFVNGNYVGGCDDFKKKVNSGELVL